MAQPPKIHPLTSSGAGGVAPDQAAAGFGPTSWEIVSAVNGRGTLLLGPWLRGSQHSGAWVFAPPGVRLATPITGDPDDPPLSVFGWREAYWSLDPAGDAVIDHAQPLSLETCQLGQVLEHVLEKCPQHLDWVAGELDRYVRVLHLQTCSAGGRRAPSADLAARTLAALIEDSEDALRSFDEDLDAAGMRSGSGLRAGDLRRTWRELEAIPFSS